MENLLEIVSQWHIIIQGALGSALFWLLLALAQKIFEFGNEKFTQFSREAKIADLTNERLKILASLQTGKEQAVFAPILVYRMSRPLLKAFLWLTLALAFSNFSFLLSTVGYLGSVYYLLKAQHVVKGKPKGEKEELEARLEQIIAETNHLKIDN